MKVVDLRELALKKVKITGNVIGKFGTFEIEQVYKNNTKDVLEVGYTFPIVETATVVGFEINVGDRVLKGKCKEKGEAKKEYQRNIVKGNSAYMMEQETDNIFKISVGKIDRDEEVKIKIQYVDKFEITDNTIQVLMPTLVTPRYKSKITSKLVYGKVDYTIDFNININKTINRKSISCSSHKINVIDEDKRERVEVLNYDLSKDFKLNIELKNELSSNAITSKTRDGKDMIYLSFMPEILDSYEDSEKEYLFIIDVSGSMMGEKLKETKHAVIECLKQLDTGDKFNIIPFESDFEAMNIKSIEYNEENMEKAIKYINSLKPLGGTEILDPIKFALYERDTEKIILLFTDGQVGNEDEIIKFVEDNINRSRIFPFGIDTNVNSSFIKQLAKAGNGKAELIQPKEKIDDKIIRTFARIQTPLLEEIKIDYGNNKVLDEIREEKCLFNYEFFNVFAKIEKLEDDIQLKGKILDKQYIWKINKDNIYNTEVDLEVLFAKQEMERLEEYIRNTYEDDKIENYKKMIIELSEKYNINSKYTSFITVYERKDKLLEVPKYQETKLSSKFAKDAIMNKVWDMLGMDECEEDYEEEYECDLAAQSFLRKNSSSSSGDLDIPCFLRKKKVVNSEYKSAEIKKTNEEILAEKVDDYYKVFISQDKKSILTFLLYALYYLRKGNTILNYNELLRFLGKHRDELLENELYLKLLCLCYKELDNNRFLDKKETLELMDDNFRKITVTNLKISVEFKELSKSEIQEIVDNDKLIENIDKVIQHLIKTDYSAMSWLR
jgi:Ca-activated chloride channel family protein